MQETMPEESAHPVRDLFARPWRWAMYGSGLALRQAKSIRLPRILMYHVVADGYLSPARFTWQLQCLRQHFEPVALDELVRRVAEGTAHGGEVALTFDDGLRNHYAVVWPLLQAHGVPATFFVCSDLIESDAWIWRTELRQRLRLLPGTTRTHAAREAGCPVGAIDGIMEWTKSLSATECQTFRNKVAALTPRFSPTPEQAALHAPMTWDQLRAMDPALITIGSHTRTHPLLTMLTDAQLQDEIVGSKQVLETGLDRPVELFCYPNGIITPGAVALVRANYHAGVSIYNGFVHREDDPALLPRIPADGSRATFVRRLHRPAA